MDTGSVIRLVILILLLLLSGVFSSAETAAPVPAMTASATNSVMSLTERMASSLLGMP